MSMKVGLKQKRLNAGAFTCSTHKYASSPPETTLPSSSVAGATRLATTRIHLLARCRPTPSAAISVGGPTAEETTASTAKAPIEWLANATAAPNACSGAHDADLGHCTR